MVNCKTQITDVVVYPDRARLTRQGKVKLESGRHTLEVTELPLELIPASLRATGRGTAKARLLSVQAQRFFYAETPAEQVQELEKKLEAAQDELRGQNSQAETIQQTRLSLLDLFKHTDTFVLGLASGEMSQQAQEEIYQHVRQQIEKLDREMLDLSIKRRALEKRIEQLKNQLNQLRSARPRQRYTALVEVEIIEKGDLEIELSYLVEGASWQPQYDLRLIIEDAKPILELTYLAEIMQMTGETWENIRISLSTARPTLAGVLPELNPWYVGPRPQPVVFANRGTSLKLTAAHAAPASELADAAPELPITEAETALARVDDSGAAVTYHVTDPVSVPADNRPHKVSIAVVSLPVQLDYVSAPKLVEAAYRRARITNDSPYTLLPGEVNLFSNGEYLGTTKFELTPSQDEIEVYLGTEDRIRIERELKRREVDKSLIGGKRRIHFGYQITLENLLDNALEILLHDQIPVSRREDIKVRLESAEPRPIQQTELNLLDWEFRLNPKEKRQVRFDFVVEYPQDQELLGLNL